MSNLSLQLYNEFYRDPERILDLYAEFAPLHLRYHRILLECGPIALAHMGKRIIGCSGTLHRKDTFARDIAEGCLLQEGTEGQIMVKMTADVEQGKSHLLTVKEPDPHHVLEAEFKKRGDDAKRLRALIDVSGLFRRLSNQQVAETVLNYNKLNQDIDAVIYLQKRGDQECFVLLKRGSSLKC